jgi:hypothetical protein
MFHPGNAFDPWKFSRGLHRIALGALTMFSGVDAALERRYDRVRDYVRRPQSRLVWPYLQRITDKRLGHISLPRWIEERGRYAFSFVTAAHYSLVYMNLFIDEFIVALDGRLDAQPANEIARRSQLPEAELSRRAWMLIRERLQSYWPVLE